MINIKKIFCLIFLSIMFFVLIGCGIILPEIETSNNVVNTETKLPSPTNTKVHLTSSPSPKPDKIYDILKIQQAFESVLNERLWWEGDKALDYYFYNSRIKYILYVDESLLDKGRIDYYFLVKDLSMVRYASYGIGEYEFGILLSYGGGRIFDPDEDFDFAKNYHLNLGYKKIGEGEIFIKDIIPPVYSPMNNEKQKILQRVKEYVIKKFDYEKAPVKFYIRDFNIQPGRNMNYIDLVAELGNEIDSYNINVSENEIGISRPENLSENYDFWKDYIKKVEDNAVMSFGIN